MNMKNFKPYTSTRRHAVLTNRDQLWKGSSEKSLTKKYKSKAGRNNSGRITLRHRGGGHKKKYRIIDFKRNKIDILATVVRMEYDPIRTANIALIEYDDKTKAYIIAPDKLKVGENFLIGVCPENANPGEILHDFTNLPRLVGGINDNVAKIIKMI